MSTSLRRNAAECVLCGHVLESWHHHDFRVHNCYAVAMGAVRRVHFFVDGGLAYVRRGWGGPGMSMLPESHFIERSDPPYGESI